tara:strand:- start:8041 stop:8832 length:792 start_codon:yes stop_codon:yes gene_type:complete
MDNNSIKKISYSALKKWKECPYKFYLNYVKDLKSFKGNEYTAFGTAIHEACEACLGPSEENDLNKVFLKSFKNQIKNLREDEVDLDDNLLSNMESQAKPICENVLPALKSYIPEFEVFSIEEEILEDIEQFNSFGTSFKGFIDLVLKTPDGKYHIIDWKTCSWGWDSKKKSDPMINYQLTYYKIFLSKKHNIDLDDIETHFALLKRTAKQNIVEFFRVSSGPKKIQNSLKVLENAVINIENKNFIKNRLSCKYCDFYKTEHCK